MNKSGTSNLETFIVGVQQHAGCMHATSQILVSRETSPRIVVEWRFAKVATLCLVTSSKNLYFKIL